MTGFSKLWMALYMKKEHLFKRAKQEMAIKGQKEGSYTDLSY